MFGWMCHSVCGTCMDNVMMTVIDQPEPVGSFGGHIMHACLHSANHTTALSPCFRKHVLLHMHLSPTAVLCTACKNNRSAAQSDS
jgi:hypothetical protein